MLQALSSEGSIEFARLCSLQPHDFVYEFLLFGTLLIAFVVWYRHWSIQGIKNDHIFCKSTGEELLLLYYCFFNFLVGAVLRESFELLLNRLTNGVPDIIQVDFIVPWLAFGEDWNH